MSSNHGSPALVEVIEEEPEINGVECSRIILTRDIGLEAVVVSGLVVVSEYCLDGALYGADGCVHIAVMLLCFRE